MSDGCTNPLAIFKRLQRLAMTSKVTVKPVMVHLDDQTQPTFEMTPGFKPFTVAKIHSKVNS